MVTNDYFLRRRRKNAMAYSEYWNPKNETLPREELQALQLLKLGRMCDWAYANSPFHHRKFDEAGFMPEQLKTLDDIRRIPFMTREEWMHSIMETPMFGDVVATAETNAIRYHLTSGTSGRTPIRVLDGMKDWEWIAEMWCYGLWGFGIRPEDITYFAFGYGSFIGFWGAHYGVEKIGSLVIPGGAQTSEGRIKQIIEMEETTGGGMGRKVRRYSRHDRTRHHHDLRVLAPAGGHTHHRRSFHRGGA